MLEKQRWWSDSILSLRWWAHINWRCMYNFILVKSRSNLHGSNSFSFGCAGWRPWNSKHPLCSDKINMKSSRLTPKHKPHMTERRETSPHWSERLVSAILQRDNIMITELHQMNQNIQRLLTTQIEHNQEIKNILQSHRSHEREHHHHNHHHDSQRHHHTTPNIAEDE